MFLILDLSEERRFETFLVCSMREREVKVGLIQSWQDMIKLWVFPKKR